ncbi:MULTISPECIES: VOC family protein [unclassified Leeuwenhoekiella]|uniref:VOC family protein n=1 Tax=unclassified Leeuwenhoekiella TaxID=2615029 RepID=UPI0026C562FB|tara:strand:+ start:8021 stop:8497 length:477 start_codon:yes stop_codon:yes gene_type:complete
MKKAALSLLLVAAFSLGFTTNTLFFKQPDTLFTMKRVTGIGGIFFKSKDPEKITEWYHKHLGLETNPYGATFEWFQEADPSTKAQTQWTPFAETSNYFGSSGQDYMINYRVEDLEELVNQLKKEGVEVVDEMETYDYGKFIHILDGEGNKVQLWEPID